MHRISRWLVDVSIRFRKSSGGAIAAAIIRRAKTRTALRYRFKVDLSAQSLMHTSASGYAETATLIESWII
jgi:hypothetical protein